MGTTAKLTEVQRAIERLHGILAGVSCDYLMNDAEIGGLRSWIEIHEHLHKKEPFRGLVKLLNRCLEDQVIDEDEREEILDWCLSYTDGNSLGMTAMTEAIQRLHGVLQGILIDGTITDDEVFGLNDWLHDYDMYAEYWPFCDVWAEVRHILEDGKIEEHEKADLMDLCHQFSERIVPRQEIHDTHDESWMKSESPILQTFDLMCDREAVINFKSKFCFTGQARGGSRKDLQGMAEALGGRCQRHVSLDLDYLVIGAQSSPAWVYATYGRKIEKAIEYNRRADVSITVIHEDDFLGQVLIVN